MNDKIILVDTMAYIFRFYYSTIRMNMTNNEGFPTGSIFGVNKTIEKIKKMFPTHRIIFVTDSPGGNFRHEIYPDYKANRSPAPDELIVQIDPVYELIKNHGIPLIRVPGVEADDSIATISKMANSLGIETIIASSDKDLMQLVNENTRMLDSKWDLIDADGVKDKMLVNPSQISHLLALTGDVADNIPGVHKVGIKTAAKWLGEYGDLDGIKDNKDLIKGKVGEHLRNGLDMLDLSYSLVKLKFDVELPFDPIKKQPDLNKDGLEMFFKRYNIKF